MQKNTRNHILELNLPNSDSALNIISSHIAQISKEEFGLFVACINDILGHVSEIGSVTSTNESLHDTIRAMTNDDTVLDAMDVDD